MPGSKKVNSNLNIDGSIKVSTVPNLGTNATYILTQNPSTKEISQRTNSEIISDLNLTTTSWVSTNYIPKTHPVYNVTQGNIDSWNWLTQNYLGYIDDRIISPNDLGTKKIQFGFTSFTNNNAGPWADFIHFGGYQDAGGGNQNLIVFNKTNFGIRQYQGTFQSGTSYNNYVDYWHSGNFNPNNYLPLSGGTMSGTINFTNNTGQIGGLMGDNDFWRIKGASNSSNLGYLELATADDGTEPITVSQYFGEFKIGRASCRERV